jgi:hypothetical protein
MSYECEHEKLPVAYSGPIHINISDFLIFWYAFDWSAYSTTCFQSIHLHYLLACFKMLSDSNEKSVLFVLGSLACFPSDLIWNYGSYRQLVGFLERVKSLVARPMPTQDSKNTEENGQSCLECDSKLWNSAFQRPTTYNALDCMANERKTSKRNI